MLALMEKQNPANPRLDKCYDEIKALTENIPVMLTALEDEFQKLLGLSADVKRSGKELDECVHPHRSA